MDDKLLLKAADAFVTRRVDEPNCSEADQLRAALEAYEAARAVMPIPSLEDLQAITSRCEWGYEREIAEWAWYLLKEHAQPVALPSPRFALTHDEFMKAAELSDQPQNDRLWVNINVVLQQRQKAPNLAAIDACLAEAADYLGAAVQARREGDFGVGLEDALSHIHDALRRARGIPRGDGYPESYPHRNGLATELQAEAEVASLRARYDALVETLKGLGQRWVDEDRGDVASVPAGFPGHVSRPDQLRRVWLKQSKQPIAAPPRVALSAYESPIVASTFDAATGEHTPIVKDPRFDELVRRLDRQEAAIRVAARWTNEEAVLKALEQKP